MCSNMIKISNHDTHKYEYGNKYDNNDNLDNTILDNKKYDNT